MSHSVWIRELRVPFLMLPVVCVPLGTAVALYTSGKVNLLFAILALAGVTCLHGSVNVLNDYFDYKSGIDIVTTPTPFSGGSRILPENKMTPRAVLAEGLMLLLAGVAMGVYFIIRFNLDPILIVILALAAFFTVAYSPLVARKGFGEISAGLGLGFFVVLGSYYVQTRVLSIGPVISGAAMSVLIACILYINEFPDTEADKAKGRLHLVARWGKKKAASRYRYIILSAYAILVLGAVTGLTTPFVVLGLLALPKAVNAYRVLEKNYEGIMEIIPGMADTVMATLWTGFLCFIAYIIAWLLPRLIAL